MKSCLLSDRLGWTMPTKIFISAGDPRSREKLEQMTAIDPSVSGGIGEIVLGRRLLGRSEPIATMFKSGYEEIHEIAPGFCTHITDTFIEQDWRLTIRSRENNLRFRLAFAGEAAYFDRKHRLSIGPTSKHCSTSARVRRPTPSRYAARFRLSAPQSSICRQR